MKDVRPKYAPLLASLLLSACWGGSHDLLTAAVARADISQRVTASGTLAAQDTVLVGSQVSGTIANLYVDYNSPVHRGQVLARLDPSLFVAALDQSQATLRQLQATRAAATSSLSSSIYTSSAAEKTAQSQQQMIAAADEDVQRARAAFDLAALTLHRDRALLRQGYVAQNVVDADVSNAEAARDALVAAQTQAKTSRLASTASHDQAGSSAAQAAGAAAAQRASDAAVRAAAAAVRQAQINLDHATIVSPVDGTVIQRNVSVGQTVAAALQAPTLFTIAKDLAKMELDIAVGEPDVGAVRRGQRVAFSVLAYPGRIFTTTVSEVRQNPTVVNNVTTYDTVAYPPNRDGALRPGMTANVQITVATYRDATVVPLAALQWRPSAAVAKRYRVVAPPSAGESSKSSQSIWGATGGTTEFAISAGSEGHCYVLDGRTLRGVRINVLAVDGTRVGVTVEAGTLEPGDRVVTDDSAP
ncbi:MAG TPA: efflux RND transporter periplasmic adaptor subunit [Candidatus Binatia bacterium]|nr:efflux RND transporter periplasmic adaptor subunit [Candidatus Binatia bacterium]